MNSDNSNKMEIHTYLCCGRSPGFPTEQILVISYALWRTWSYHGSRHDADDEMRLGAGEEIWWVANDWLDATKPSVSSDLLERHTNTKHKKASLFASRRGNNKSLLILLTSLSPTLSVPLCSSHALVTLYIFIFITVLAKFSISLSTNFTSRLNICSWFKYFHLAHFLKQTTSTKRTSCSSLISGEEQHWKWSVSWKYLKKKWNFK